MLTATKTLRVFENPHHAEILRTRLDAAGILSVINGAEVATMLSHIGTAVAKVRLEVAPEDFERAQEILHQDEQQRADKTDWNCGRCDEANDASFDLCWSCSKQRDDADGSAKPVTEQGLPSDPFVLTSDATQPASVLNATNPYAPTSGRLDRPPRRGQSIVDGELSDEPSEELSRLVSRTFVGAIFSPLLLPPLISVYVLYLLTFRIPGEAYQFPCLRKKLISAWVITALGATVGTVWVMSLLG